MTAPNAPPADDTDKGRAGGGRRARALAVRVVVVLVVGGVVLLTVLTVIQDQFVYLPDRAMPAAAALQRGAEEVKYPAADGLTVHGWFLPARGTATGTTAVVFHGNAGNRAAAAELGGQLADGGMSVLLAEYRGFGDTAGEPSEAGLRDDAVGAIAYARSRPDVDASRIVAVGYSLGTGVAVEAAEVTAPAALVLLAPYTSLPDVAWSRLPGLPYHHLMRTQFDSLSRVPGLHSPVLVVRGSADQEIPPEQSQRVFDAANQPKQLVTLPGADHGLRSPMGATGAAATLAFVDQVLPSA